MIRAVRPSLATPVRMAASTSACARLPIVLVSAVPKAGPTATTTSFERPGRASLIGDEIAWRAHLWQRLDLFPTRAADAVASAGAGVVVRIVDPAQHAETAIEDRRGLEIVAGDALAAHLQHVRRHLGEAARLQRPHRRQNRLVA